MLFKVIANRESELPKKMDKGIKSYLSPLPSVICLEHNEAHDITPRELNNENKTEIRKLMFWANFQISTKCLDYRFLIAKVLE